MTEATRKRIEKAAQEIVDSVGRDTLRAWQQREKAVTMNNDQWSKLIIYLHMTTNYRKDEADSWGRLAEEKDEDGKPKFKNAASNAEFWRDLMNVIEDIIKVIENQ